MVFESSPWKHFKLIFKDKILFENLNMKDKILTYFFIKILGINIQYKSFKNVFWFFIFSSIAKNTI